MKQDDETPALFFLLLLGAAAAARNRDFVFGRPGGSDVGGPGGQPPQNGQEVGGADFPDLVAPSSQGPQAAPTTAGAPLPTWNRYPTPGRGPVAPPPARAPLLRTPPPQDTGLPGPIVRASWADPAPSPADLPPPVVVVQNPDQAPLILAPRSAPPSYGSVTATRSTSFEGPIDFQAEAAARPAQTAQAAITLGTLVVPAGAAGVGARGAVAAASPAAQSTGGAAVVRAGASLADDVARGLASFFQAERGAATVGTVSTLAFSAFESVRTGKTWTERRRASQPRPLWDFRWPWETKIDGPGPGQGSLYQNPDGSWSSNESGNPVVLP